MNRETSLLFTVTRPVTCGRVSWLRRVWWIKREVEPHCSVPCTAYQTLSHHYSVLGFGPLKNPSSTLFAPSSHPPRTVFALLYPIHVNRVWNPEQYY